MDNTKTIKLLLTEMEFAAQHPGQMIRKWKEENGRKVIGCLPIHNSGAEELVHAAGMLPVGLWGGQTTISRASEYLQAFCCSIMKSVMEFALTGEYRDLDGIISPNTCDTMRCIPLMIKEGVPGLPVIGLVYPDNRKIDAGIKYLSAEYHQLANALEEISGTKISLDDLEKSIGIYNSHRVLMNEFLELAEDHLDIINFYYRQVVIKSSFFVPKEQHIDWLLQLNQLLKEQPARQWDGYKVVVTGIIAEPIALQQMFDEFKLAVVADDLAHGSRQFRTPVPSGDDPFLRLAQRFASFEGCATVYDPAKLRGQMISDTVSRHEADGVVVMMMKFCDPEEYDYPYIKQDLEKEGIPILYLEIEQQMESIEQIRTRLQAFVEMLARKKK